MRSEAQPQAVPAHDYPVKPVPFTAVHVTDSSGRRGSRSTATVTIPFAFEKCEETGRVDNFERAAAALQRRAAGRPKPPGYPFDDTDIYKVLEGAAYTLSVQPDPKLDALPRRPDREDRRGAGEGRLPLHGAHDRPGASAPLGRPEALGARRESTATSSTTSAISTKRRSRTTRRPASARCSTSRCGRPICSTTTFGPGKRVDLARAPDHRDGPRRSSIA